MKNNDKKYISEVAKKYNADYQEVKALMSMAKKSCGLSYKEFSARNYYRWGTIEKIEEKYNKRKNRYFNKISNNTGKDFASVKRKAEFIYKFTGIGYDQYYRKQLYLLSPSQLLKWGKKKLDGKKHLYQTVKKETGWSTGQVKRHIEYVRKNYGINQSYYYLMRLWELDDEKLSTYAHGDTSKRLSAKYNRKTKVLYDKSRFNKAYKDYIGRKFWSNESEDFESFEAFVSGLEWLFIKPIDLQSGVGAEKLRVADFKSTQELFEYLTSMPPTVVEECVVQHPQMSKMNPTSINTVRLVTIMQNGQAKPLCSFVRFGRKGKVTDNFGQGGVLAGVDIETGKIVTPAIDEEGVVHHTHPDSGEQLVGFQIPYWDKVLDIALKALAVKDNINYVGWDVAICEDKVVIIEGNSQPGICPYQSAYATIKSGQAHIFKPYLD